MKSKWILLVLLAIGLAACTKEVDSDINNLQKQIGMPWESEDTWDNTDEYKYVFGEFEGVWFVDQHEVDTAKLTVTNVSFLVRYPLGYVVDKYFGKENKMYLAQYKSHYSGIGFSNNTLYCDFMIHSWDLQSVDNLAEKMAGNDSPETVPFIISLGAGVATYDTTTHLWTLKVTLEGIWQNWTFDDEGVRHNPIQLTPTTPITLVYIARKKISE